MLGALPSLLPHLLYMTRQGKGTQTKPPSSRKGHSRCPRLHRMIVTGQSGQHGTLRIHAEYKKVTRHNRTHAVQPLSNLPLVVNHDDVRPVSIQPLLKCFLIPLTRR